MDLKNYVTSPVSKRYPRYYPVIVVIIALTLFFFMYKVVSHFVNLPHNASSASLSQTVQEPQPLTPLEPITAIISPGHIKQYNIHDSSNEPWRTIVIQKGDSLERIFKKSGLPRHTLPNILKNIEHKQLLQTIKPGQQLHLSIQHAILDKLIMPLNEIKSLEIERHNNTFVSKLNMRPITPHTHYLTATVQGSLSNTAKRYKIPYKLMRQMAAILSNEINFSKDIRAGDQFTIVYKAYFIENQQIDSGEIYAINYTNRGNLFQAFLHKNPQGESNYYTAGGQSLNKAFTRFPVKFSHISSTFSLSRMHPKLHRRRPHRGIDLAAPIGTPIYSTGDGRIVSLGWQNGYGNMVKIRHNVTYSTLYAHMLKFPKGLQKGDKVKRGQIIGYVGQTGLATGPHCHYEFHVNNRAVNPSAVKLPKASSIPAEDIAEFKIHANKLIARMKLFEQATLAARQVPQHIT